MSGVHDMGGVPGYGPVVVEQNEPLFHEEWERRIFGIMTTSGHRRFPMRPAIESIDPETYIESGYYEKWLLALENGFVENDDLTISELRERADHFVQQPGAEVSQNKADGLTQLAWDGRYSQRSPKYDATPAFSIGDDVMTVKVVSTGHTRLPHYAQGKRGVVHVLRGVYDLLELKVRGVFKPEPVYAVGFDAQELWGDQAESKQGVYIDVWESYLTPAPLR